MVHINRVGKRAIGESVVREAMEDSYEVERYMGISTTMLDNEVGESKQGGRKRTISQSMQ